MVERLLQKNSTVCFKEINIISESNNLTNPCFNDFKFSQYVKKQLKILWLMFYAFSFSSIEMPFTEIEKVFCGSKLSM